MLQLHAALRAMTDDVHISVADVNGQIVGYCAYGASGAASSPRTQAGIYDLFVHPQAWNGGVGRALLTAATARLAAHGFTTAHLFVYEANTRGRAFYQRCGWTADGHRELAVRTMFVLPVLRYWQVFRG